MTALRKKSLLLTGYLEYLIKLELSEDVTIFTPENPEERGCQLSLAFPTADVDTIFNQLKGEGVICDIRKPNIMRVAPTPLYNSFADVYEFISILKQILTSVRA
jgi:kynureninase